MISSFNIVANNNYAIVLLEDFPCESKEELHKRERFYTRSSLTCVNKIKNQGLLAEVGKKKFRRLIDKEYYEKNRQYAKRRNFASKYCFVQKSAQFWKFRSLVWGDSAELAKSNEFP